MARKADLAVWNFLVRYPHCYPVLGPRFLVAVASLLEALPPCSLAHLCSLMSSSPYSIKSCTLHELLSPFRYFIILQSVCLYYWGFRPGPEHAYLHLFTKALYLQSNLWQRRIWYVEENERKPVMLDCWEQGGGAHCKINLGWDLEVKFWCSLLGVTSISIFKGNNGH